MSSPRELFLSHGHADDEFVVSLADVLRYHGVPCWYSERDIAGGQQWMDEIGSALDRCDWFAVVMTPTSVARRWVKRETQYALLEDQYADHIIPILKAECDYKRMAWPLATFEYVDFKSSFDDGCRQLLKRWGIGLRTGGQRAPERPTTPVGISRTRVDVPAVGASEASDASVEAFEQLAAVSVMGSGLVVPGRTSRMARSLTIDLKRPLSEGKLRARVVVETPGVFFASAGRGEVSVVPLLTAGVESNLVAGASGREMVVELTGPTNMPPQITLTLFIWTEPNVRPGAILEATVSIDNVPGRALASMGFVGDRAFDADVTVAALPTVLLGYSAQPTGLVSIMERRSGVLGEPEAKFLRLRLTDPYRLDRSGRDAFTYPAWLIVKEGDVKIAAGIGTTDDATSVQGRPFDGVPSCLEWEISSPSTVPSILQIRGATASGPLSGGAVNGPTISVDPSRPSGPVMALVELLDEERAVLTAIGAVVVAFAAPKAGGAVVETTSAPGVIAGASAQSAGNITVAFVQQIDKAGAVVSLEIETPGVTFALDPDVLHPIAASNVHGGADVRWRQDRTTETQVVLEMLGHGDTSLPYLTISNIHYNVAPSVLAGTPVSLKVEWSDTNARHVVPYVTNAIVRAREV